MKQFKRILLMLALGAFCLGGALGASALGLDSIQTFYIEQTYVNVPEMDVFVYAMNSDGVSLSPNIVSAAGVQLTLGDHKLDTGTITMAGEPICYIFALDNSTAVSEEAFAAYKRSILNLQKTMGERDQLLIYTLAGDTTLLLDESATAKEVTAALAELKQEDEDVDLVGGLTQISAYITQNFQSLAPRKAVFACTGAMQLMSDTTALAGLISGEGISSLNMAVFAFAANDVSQSMHMLTSLTSGRITPCEVKNIEEAVQAKQQYLANALEIKTSVDSALAGEKMDALTLSVPSLGSAVKVTTNVYMGHSLARPEVESVRVMGRNHLLVTFNQAVDRADLAAAYVVRSQDIWNWNVTVKSASLQKDGRSAVLTVAPLYGGKYTVQLRKVVSRVSNANTCTNEKVSFTVKGWPRDRAFYLARFRSMLLLLAVALAVFVCYVVWQRRKERQSEVAAETEHLLSMADEVTTSLPKRFVTLYVDDKGAIAQKRFSAMVESSLILGSDPAQCDFCVAGSRVRPQHCALSLEGDGVYLQPLAKSVVYCNEERIADAHRLKNNDIITIGGVKIQVVL